MGKSLTLSRIFVWSNLENLPKMKLDENSLVTRVRTLLDSSVMLTSVPQDKQLACVGAVNCVVLGYGRCIFCENIRLIGFVISAFQS